MKHQISILKKIYLTEILTLSTQMNM